MESPFSNTWVLLNLTSRSKVVSLSVLERLRRWIQFLICRFSLLSLLHITPSGHCVFKGGQPSYQTVPRDLGLAPVELSQPRGLMYFLVGSSWGRNWSCYGNPHFAQQSSRFLFGRLWVIPGENRLTDRQTVPLSHLCHSLAVRPWHIAQSLSAFLVSRNVSGSWAISKQHRIND